MNTIITQTLTETQTDMPHAQTSHTSDEKVSEQNFLVKQVFYFTRAAEKIDCPFSMPMGRKERPTMTKPKEKTREELQAEIEDGKKKIRQFENREKMLRQKLSKEERRTRSHRLMRAGDVMESIVPELRAMTDEEAPPFPTCFNE